jgi:nicotinamide mononucleotide transporter
MEILERFLDNIRNTSALEYIAVVFGIASVWFSRVENILVYPVGLVNTIIYIYLSIDAQLFGEATVNLYYTIMSIYGWVLWAKKDNLAHHLVIITASNGKEWIKQLLFFCFFYLAIYFSLAYLKKHFTPQAIPWADALASASAFTAMWLMAKKKVESWYWWIVTNITSIPLYFVKDYVLTGGYYLILLVMAFWGLHEWAAKARENRKVVSVDR